MFVRIIVTLALLALHRATPASSADGDGRIDSSEWTSNSSPSSSPPPSESGLHSPSASWPDFVQGLPASQAIGIPVEESIASASAKDGIRGSHASGQPFQGSLDRAPTDPGPSSPPGLHVDFPPGHEAPVVDRHFAGVIAISTYHGSTTPVPRTVLEDPGVRSRLLAYTHWFIEHPEYEFLHHPDAMQGLANHQHAFSYMYRPLTPKEFGYIFPRANVDWAQVIPVMVLRMRLPQRFPWQYGKLEIAGVEMIQPTQYLQVSNAVAVKEPLWRILARIAMHS